MATNRSDANTHTVIVGLMGRMSRLETENRELKGKMEQNSGRNDALGIENEEMKRLRRETEDGLSCIRNDFSGRLKEVSDKQQGVSDAITALQEGIAEISHKIGRIEGKQSEDHLIIQAGPVPLGEKRQLIPGQVDKGTILLLGGRKDNRVTDEMVILKQDKWIKLALKLPKILYNGGAVYLDGEIYIFGGVGMYEVSYKLDNKTLEWIRLADMNEERRCITNSSVEWNGSIWVFGGERKRSYLKSVERYGPKENKWIKMPARRDHESVSRPNKIHTWAVRDSRPVSFRFLGNRVPSRPVLKMAIPPSPDPHSRRGSSLNRDDTTWLNGGRNNINARAGDLKSVERYDPKENKWIKMPDMKYKRESAAAAVHNGKFIVCGGMGDGFFNRLKSVECFDPESGVWTEMNDMPTPLHGHSLVSYGNNLILMGGYDGKTIVNTVLGVSNLEGKGTWKQLPPMEQPRMAFSATVLDNEIFVIGGYYETFKYLDKTEIFNGNSWREGPQLPNVCNCMSSIVIPCHLADILSNSTE